MRKITLGILVLILTIVMVGCGDSLVENELSNNNEVENNAESNNDVVENTDNNEAADNEETNNNEGNADAGDSGDATEGFEDLIAYLDAMELEPGEATPAEEGIPESLGAEKGILLPIGDIEVQFFIYNEDSESFDQDQYDEAQEEGTVTFDAAGEDFTIPMLMNGDLGMANYEDHYMKEELVEAFTNF